jgi:hypothetical protein
MRELPWKINITRCIRSRRKWSWHIRPFPKTLPREIVGNSEIRENRLLRYLRFEQASSRIQFNCVTAKLYHINNVTKILQRWVRLFLNAWTARKIMFLRPWNGNLRIFQAIVHVARFMKRLKITEDWESSITFLYAKISPGCLVGIKLYFPFYTLLEAFNILSTSISRIKFCCCLECPNSQLLKFTFLCYWVHS